MLKIFWSHDDENIWTIFWAQVVEYILVHDVENISTIFWSQVVEGLNCTGWDQGDKPFLIARIAGRMYVDVSKHYVEKNVSLEHKNLTERCCRLQTEKLEGVCQQSLLPLDFH